MWLITLLDDGKSDDIISGHAIIPFERTMSQAYEVLVTEVDRVVNSPYPTQLKVG